MIVKNESKVIQRCLKSVKKYIDSWIIVDTGSDDCTKELILETLQGVDGEVIEREWVDFSQARNEALIAAKGMGDYLLFIDADEVMVAPESFQWPSLTKDCYLAYFLLENGAWVRRIFLARQERDWSWRGSLHEQLYSNTSKNGGVLTDCWVRVTQEGARSQDFEKYSKDAALLKKACKEEPQNARSRFYLALSLEMAGQYDEALSCYRQRSMMIGCKEEQFYALYRVGCLEKNFSFALLSLNRAFLNRSHRSEPLFMMGLLLWDRRFALLTYLLSTFALTIPFPLQDGCFVEKEIYDFKLLIQKADAAIFLKRYREAYSLWCALLSKKELPPEKREKMQEGLEKMERLI